MADTVPMDLDSATHRLHATIKKKDLVEISQIIAEYRRAGGNVKDLLNHRIYDSWFANSICVAVRHWHRQHCACDDHFTNPGVQTGPCNDFVAHPSTNAIVEFLLENGADPMIKDYYDYNAIQNATIKTAYFSEPAPETLAVFRLYGYEC